MTREINYEFNRGFTLNSNKKIVGCVITFRGIGLND